MSDQMELVFWEDLIPRDHAYRPLRACLCPSEEAGLPRLLILQLYEGWTDAEALRRLGEDLPVKWFCGHAVRAETPSPEAYRAFRAGLSPDGLLASLRAAQERLAQAGLDPSPLAFADVQSLRLALAQGEQADAAKLGQTPAGSAGPDWLLFRLREGRLLPKHWPLLGIAPEDRLLLLTGQVPESAGPSLRRALGPFLAAMSQSGSACLLLLNLGGEADWTEALWPLEKLLQAHPAASLGASDPFTSQTAQAAYHQASLAHRALAIRDACGLKRYRDIVRRIHIVNLMLAGKRDMLEITLKANDCARALAVFEDIADRLDRARPDMIDFQIRHELQKLCMAVFNGILHYDHDRDLLALYEQAVERMLSDTFAGCVRHLRDLIEQVQSGSFQELMTPNYYGHVRQALDYLETHYGGDLSLGGVAEQLGITSEYLSAIFRKQTGRNFHEYLLDIRMQHACRLLATPRSRVEDVAGQVGFVSADYFSRVFRKYMNMTPRQYQQRKGFHGR